MGGFLLVWYNIPMLSIKNDLIAAGTKRRSGTPNLGIKFIVAHDTGNPESTAQQNVNYYKNSANDVEASAHYFVDDKQIICCIPEDEKAWHVRKTVGIDKEIYGVLANDCAIAIELCYGDGIDENKAYQNYIELMADICKRYKLNPLKHIIGHYKLDPERRSDPINAFMTMENKKIFLDFINDVNKLVVTPPPVQPVTPKPPKDDTFKKNLRYGDKGPDVALLQKVLRKLKYFYYPWDTGNYLILTKQAVCAFQKAQKLSNTGVLDSATREKLNAMV